MNHLNLGKTVTNEFLMAMGLVWFAGIVCTMLAMTAMLLP